MKSRRRQRVCGFTLVEILMAMAIFGLVLAAIYATWTLILKSKNIGETVTAQIQRERIAVRVIEEALMSARSFAANVEYYGFLAENGEDATLSFVARLPKSFPRSGRFGDFDVRRVTFSVESGRAYGQRQLVMRQQPILMDLDEDEKDHPLVLARGVREMMFQFWDTQLNEWVDEWPQTNQLPKLVKFSLEFGSPNQGYSSQAKDEVTRMVALPSISVPANWQVPTPGRVAGPAPIPPVPTPLPPPPAAK